MRFVSLVIALFVCNICNAQTWEKITLSPSLNLTHSSFWQDTGIVITPDGYVLHTVDFGSSWRIDSTLFGNSLLDLDFSSRSVGYISTPQYGGVYRTIDGGLTWNLLPVSNFLGDIGSAIDFVSTNIGYGVHYLDGGCQSTQNGGQNWQYNHIGFGCKQLFSIQFINDSMGYALGSTSTLGGMLSIYKTSDYANSWQPLGELNMPAEGDIYVRDSTILVVSSFLIKKSIDFGNTFSQVMYDMQPENSFTNNTPQAISFYYDTGYVAFLKTIYRTVDGGNNWIRTSFSCSSNENINFISAMSGDKVIVGCSNGVIYRTILGGGVWNELNEYEAQKVVSIYPNPSSDFLTVSFMNFKQPCKILITNSNGALLQQEEMINQIQTFNVGALPKGLYFVKLNSNQGAHFEKFNKH